MSLENDLIQMRQQVKRLLDNVVIAKPGEEVFLTYHDSNLTATPANPTGDGTSGGWHTTLTAASNWMSQKVGANGKWGYPLVIGRGVDGADGEDGADGAGTSIDIPALGPNFVFVGNTGSGNVGWSGGVLSYGGTDYTISAVAVGDGNTDEFIYWDDDDATTTFKTTPDLATAIAAGNWMMCRNDGGLAIPSASHKVLLAGLIQAATLSAITANLGTITAGNILALTITADKLTVGTLLADRFVTASVDGITADAGGWATISTLSGKTGGGTGSAVEIWDSVEERFVVKDASTDKIQLVFILSTTGAGGADFFKFKFRLETAAGVEKYISGFTTVSTDITSKVYRSAEIDVSSLSGVGDDDVLHASFEYDVLGMFYDMEQGSTIEYFNPTAATLSK